MPALADCISSVFSPLNTPASTGVEPVKPIVSTIIDPDDYDPGDLTYSFNGSKFYNTATMFLMLF